jgi:hypothetical protein
MASDEYESAARLDLLRQWIRDAYAGRPEDDADIAIARLTNEEHSVLLADLDGIADSGADIRRIIDGISQLRPSVNALEGVLIDLEVEMQHFRWHWKSLSSILRKYDLWTDD